MERPTALSSDLLEIYLSDHLGGATAGRALAHRAATIVSSSPAAGPPSGSAA